MPRQSHLERAMAEWLDHEGLTGYTREHRFHPRRKWRFDFAWPNPEGGGVALEVNGGVFTRGRHNRAVGYLRDAEKLLTATAHGWEVLSVPGPFIVNDGRREWNPLVIRALRQALASRNTRRTTSSHTPTQTKLLY